MQKVILVLSKEPYEIEMVQQDDNKTWKSLNPIINLEIIEQEEHSYNYSVVTKSKILNAIDNRELLNSFYACVVEKEKQKIGSSFDTEETEDESNKPNFDPEKIRHLSE